MLTWHNKLLTAFGLGAIFVLFVNMAELPEQHGKGLLPLTAEEAKTLKKRTVKKVHPNKLGLKRANEERAKHGLSELPVELIKEEETEEAAPGADPVVLPDDGALGTIPAQVDNSQLPSFPNVASQGSVPSCTTWATTYFQMSHEVCLAIGCNNKVAPTKVFAPRWTYNFINGGALVGTSFSSAYQIIEKHGAALNSEFPYSSSLSWDMNPEHWRTAINYRMRPMQFIGANTDASMVNVKQILTNGHVVTFGTYINSWVYGTIANPPGEVGSFAGQKIVKYSNGSAGAHAMTIVGFDDKIWVDINGNGLAEAQERGAFKVANSWGATWNGNGFVWVSYDSVRATSSVPGFAVTTRNQLTQSGGVYTSTYVPYTPKLLVKVTASHALRSQMGLSIGSSSTAATSPTATFTLPAVSNRGGALAFDATAYEKETSFYFDASSLYTATSPDQQLFYLTYSDNAAGSPLTVRSFEVIDPIDLRVALSSVSPTVTADGSSNRLIAGNYTIDTQAPTSPTGLSAVKVTTTGKGKKAATSTSILLSWGASTDNVGVTKYYIYRNGVKIAESTTISYKDTSAASGILYTYTVSAVDAQGNVSAVSSPYSITK
ncbi:MAG: hypothetical protein V4736_01210 [Bdellovibrionota bacterium]